MERDIIYSWSAFYNRLASIHFNNNRQVNSYNDKVHQLWVEHLEDYDKRSFSEYFIEEHGFDIGESISIKALTKLCELIPKIEDIKSTEILLIEKLKKWCKTENIKYQSADDILHSEELTESQKQWIMDYIKIWELIND